MPALHFDSSQHEPNTAFSPIPAGVYVAMIIESDIKNNRNGNGTHLKLTWQIIDSQFANRKIFSQINITNSNPTAEQIGQGQLSSLCRAVGVKFLQMTEELHEKPCKIKIVIRKDQQYGDSNDIKDYAALDGQAPTAAMAGTATNAPAEATKPAASATPPWKKAS